MGNTVILHIGMSKTATTALQRFLYENKEIFKEKGIIYPDSYRNEEKGYFEWGHHILSHKWGGWLDKSKFPISSEEAWDELSKDIKKYENSTFIISSERFQDLLILDNYLEILNYIKKKVEPATLKIIGYVRRQDDFAESHYKELVKNAFNKGNVEEYLQNLPKFYDYYNYFKRCAEIIGDENIIVRVFDKKCFYKGNIYEDFIYSCGLIMPENIIVSKELTNPSLNSAMAKIASDIQIRTLWKDPRFRAGLYNFFDNYELSENAKKPLIGSALKKEIMNRYTSSNQLLFKNFMDDKCKEAFDIKPVKNNDFFDSTQKMYSTKDVIRLLSLVARYVERMQNDLETK